MKCRKKSHNITKYRIYGFGLLLALALTLAGCDGDENTVNREVPTAKNPKGLTQETKATIAPTATPEPVSIPILPPEPTPSPTPEPTPSPTPEPTPSPTPEPTPSPTPEPTPAPTPVPLHIAIQSAVPHSATVVASGTLVNSNGEAIIDYSNTADGYVMVQYTAATDLRLKAQVKGPSTTYTYNLTPGQWTAFPFSDENGTYQVTVYRNVTGTKYASVISQTLDVTMKDAFAPFLHSNQFVNFDAAPKSVATADVLCKDATTLEKVANVYDFVVNGMVYDYQLASSVQSGYVPVLDTVLNKMSGICFDYAALMAGMLRSQGVPCKLVVGYAGEAYHAWISVWSESTGWIEGIVFFDGTSWRRMDPTFASSSGGSQEIISYINNDTNYTTKYIY